MKLVNVAWGVAIFFLITNILTTVYYNNKIEKVNTGIAIDTISSILETTNHTHSIYTFANKQYDQGLIKGTSLSNHIQEIILTYDKLISLVKTKGTSKSSEKVSSLMIQMLTLQKEGYSNKKSAIDFASDNFNKVADGKFSEAQNLSVQISNALGAYLQSNSNEQIPSTMTTPENTTNSETTTEGIMIPNNTNTSPSTNEGTDSTTPSIQSDQSESSVTLPNNP